ncbi:MAG: pseudaminic acid biosynthesis-associated methylase [Fibrobacterota bacterium]|nr:pseudaminic acid biosynthesis-associated methylase [Fibrobacterota bacterium]
MQKTEQEKFWEGTFGNEYTDRNQAEVWIPSNTALFSKILAGTRGVKTILEFGSNLGLNLHALHNLLPSAELSAIEINEQAVGELKKWGKTKVYHESILDFKIDYQRDLTLIKGVLIHINPDRLKDVYTRLVEASKRYVLVAEYYNPSPVAIPYRGHTDRLFKRDFAGEILDSHKNLRLLDYGFAYHRDPNFPQDDITWFLMEKT